MDTTVDTVDIGPLFTRDREAVRTCDAALWNGLRRTGAVVITGFPEADAVDRRARSGLRVFELPDAAKQKLSTAVMVPGNPNRYRGFWPRREEGLLQNEFFDVGPENPDAGPDLPGIDLFCEKTPWPDPDPEPEAGWRETVQAHYAHLNRVAQTMIASIGRSAGFAEAAIAARFSGEHSTLRFLSYPPAVEAPFEEADGARVAGGSHTDASGLSLLWQAQPGLQARGQDGIFRDIPVEPNAISVHVGDVMTHLTRGRVPATPHRVLAGEGARQSVGFFLEPALSAPTTPADHEGSTELRDTYGWQLLDTFARRPMWNGIVASPEDAPHNT